MAVVQISKIQLRRGKKLVSGMPQLASGELAWAIDTQELYIGNGAVSEGSPAVGNTKVLTENDSILDLFDQYQYKPNDTLIQTGINVNFPVQRTLQERLDEGRVNAASFGISGTDSTVDQTGAIQNAIYSLYLTASPSNRVAIEFDPGTYTIVGTIYMPSNVHLIGDGKGKTIFNFVKGGIVNDLLASSTLSGTAGSYPLPTTERYYTDVPTTGGSGTGLVVNVRTTANNGNYTNGNTTITVVDHGSGYVAGDTIVISSTNLGNLGTNLSITLVDTALNPVFNTSTVFEFINESSTRTQRNVLPTTYNRQAKNIRLQGFTVETNSSEIRAFNFTNVRNSKVIDVKAKGNNGSDDYTSETSTNDGSPIIIPTLISNSVALEMTATSDFLCTGNEFINFEAEGFSYGVFSNTEIKNNLFDRCTFRVLYIGISFGAGAALSNNGPIKNTVSDSLFETIARQGILIDKGYGNRSRGNTFYNVGNNGGGNANNVYSQIKFVTAGNSSFQDHFDRAKDLSKDFFTEGYITEIEGSAFKHELVTNSRQLSTSGLSVEAFRLPLNDSSGFEVEYVFQSTAYTQMRRGKMYIAVDSANNNVQLADDYEYIGTPGEDNNLIFTASLITPPGTSIKALVVSYTNINISDTNVFTYTYTALS